MWWHLCRPASWIVDIESPFSDDDIHFISSPSGYRLETASWIASHKYDDFNDCVLGPNTGSLNRYTMLSAPFNFSWPAPIISVTILSIYLEHHAAGGMWDMTSISSRMRCVWSWYDDNTWYGWGWWRISGNYRITTLSSCIWLRRWRAGSLAEAEFDNPCSVYTYMLCNTPAQVLYQRPAVRARQPATATECEYF